MQLFFRGGRALIYFGLTLIIMGTLVFLYPKFFAYIFAGLVVALGLGIVAIGIMAKPMRMPNANEHTSDRGFSSYEEIED